MTVAGADRAPASRGSGPGQRRDRDDKPAYERSFSQLPIAGVTSFWALPLT